MITVHHSWSLVLSTSVIWQHESSSVNKGFPPFHTLLTRRIYSPLRFLAFSYHEADAERPTFRIGWSSRRSCSGGHQEHSDWGIWKFHGQIAPSSSQMYSVPGGYFEGLWFDFCFLWNRNDEFNWKIPLFSILNAKNISNCKTFGVHGVYHTQLHML